jgi:hypothetical protein
MAIDDIPQETSHDGFSDSRRYTGAFVAIAIVLALLVMGEIYTLGKIGSLRQDLETQQARAAKEWQDQLASRMAALSEQNAQQLDELRTELDASAQSVGSKTSRELRHAQALVAKLQQQQQQQADELKQEIAKKADDEKVGALTQDVSATKADLGTTKQTVDTLTRDLGMARSEMGTLIARNHDEIETLRKLGERNYFEFTLKKNREQKIAGLGLILRKTNPKRHSFNLDVLADDMVVTKKNRNVDEPIFFAPSNSRVFYELVINKVSGDQVSGYLSTPKVGPAEMAANQPAAAQSPDASK